ncbi:urease accessory protein UreD [uncultured Shimia sp.]|uniref:urease accessory protein UreD n=1 Tax=uncultured Shimia sp. TaxID=573152 RepID=UPI0026151A33|nr:urease accessory protein UreD [uncultured Shimia sp.]
MRVKRRGNTTVLDHFRQSGSLKCLYPRVTGHTMQAVLVNTAGGVTGGDQFCTTVTTAPETDLTLTTQACERAYRAQSGEVGEICTRLGVAPRATLNWLPQETLLFDGCAVSRQLTVDLAEGARFLMVEPMIFGRAAMGENLTNCTFSDRIEIRRGGAPLYLDAMRLTGDVRAHLARPFIANGAGAMASVVLVCNSAEAHLDPVRHLLPETAGASLLQPDVLVLRMLAEDSYALRQSLIPILTRLSGGPLPRCWMI